MLFKKYGKQQGSGKTISQRPRHKMFVTYVQLRLTQHAKAPQYLLQSIRTFLRFQKSHCAKSVARQLSGSMTAGWSLRNAHDMTVVILQHCILPVCQSNTIGQAAVCKKHTHKHYQGIDIRHAGPEKLKPIFILYRFSSLSAQTFELKLCK